MSCVNSLTTIFQAGFFFGFFIGILFRALISIFHIFYTWLFQNKLTKNIKLTKQTKQAEAKIIELQQELERLRSKKD